MGLLDAFGYKLKKAVSTSMTQTMHMAKTWVKEKMNAAYGIPKSELEQNIQVRPATPDYLQSSLMLGTRKRRTFSLLSKGFNATQTLQGVYITIGAKQKTLKHAFIQTMPDSGHTGVFVRYGAKMHPSKGYYAQFPGTMRQRIRERKSPGIDILFRDLGLEKELMAYIKQIYPKKLESNLKYYLTIA